MMSTAKNTKNQLSALGAMGIKPYILKPGETYMNERQREHFRQILTLWRSELEHEINTTVDHLKTEDVTGVSDPLDRASLEADFNLELRTRDRERKLINKIESTIALLESGDYGYCEDCGADIGIRRLEARPTAVRCIDCKTFQEIREKQGG